MNSRTYDMGEGPEHIEGVTLKLLFVIPWTVGVIVALGIALAFSGVLGAIAWKIWLGGLP